MKKELKVKTAHAEYTGGGIYAYTGQLTDGTWFMTGDLCGNSVRIVNEDPEANYDDAWYPEWQEAHLIRDTDEKEGTKLLMAIIEKILKDMSHGARMNASEEELNDRYETLSSGGEI